MSSSGKRARIRPAEQPPAEQPPSDQARSFIDQLLRLRRPAFVYHMDKPEERYAMVDMLWSGDYEVALGRFCRANPDFINLLEQQCMVGLEADSTTAIQPRRPQALNGLPRFESVLSSVFRWRSQRCVPLETAALTIRFAHYRVPRPAWESVSFFSRLVMSREWAEDICELALTRDPGPKYTAVEAGAISAAVFDNFTIQVGYGSYATTDRKGERYDMTNWASVNLPADSAPNCTPQALAAVRARRSGIFREDVSLSAFVRSFSIIAPATIANQHERWRHYLQLASNGELDKRPSFVSPYPPTHFIWQPPIKDRLQSSYEDVNFEMNYIRRQPQHADSQVLELGGDGLTYMRIIARIAQNPQFYLFKRESPALLPRLGEHPHGTYHVLHGEWRLWWPLIERAAVIVKNKQVVQDPNVTEFNQSEHFIRILTEACAKYVVEISRTGTDYRMTAQFLRAADANLSFAYVCQFLFLFGFKYKQMRDSVRTNDSATLDLIWRESLASLRAASKHGGTREQGKTNYATMCVVLAYWGVALVEPLATAYHRSRTLRLIDAHVGWDMPIEYLNRLIGESVVSNITHELIAKFLRNLNFTHVVHRALNMIVKRNREPDAAKLKKIKTDVDLLLDWLRKSIGTTYAQATAPSNDNLLGVDMSRWGGNRTAAAKRANTPWAKRAAVMVEYGDYVRSKMRIYCHWQRWMP